MITARAYDLHVEQIFDKMTRIHAALDAAGIPYRLVGGFGVFLQVYQVDPDSARMTRDVDLAINRGDLAGIIAAAEAGGFQYRHVAGVDMLLDTSNPKGVAIHLLSPTKGFDPITQRRYRFPSRTSPRRATSSPPSPTSSS